MARRYMFTWNNPPEWNTPEESEFFNKKKIKANRLVYIIAGYELAPTTLTPHWQGFACFDSMVRVSHCKKIFGPQVHWDPVSKDTSGIYTSAKRCADYCRKGEQPKSEWKELHELGPHFGLNAKVEEYGEMPADGTTKASKVKAERYKEAMELACQGRLKDIDPGLQIRHYGNLRNIARDNMPAAPNLDGVCGIWIYGKSGCGKTTYCTKRWPDHYAKPMNKWWDGYQNQDVAILDDIDPEHSKFLGYHMKIWGDFKAFIAEIKNGAIYIRPKLFVVTSQFKIEDCWHDEETREAVKRRFTFIEWSTPLYIDSVLDGHASKSAKRQRMETETPEAVPKSNVEIITIDDGPGDMSGVSQEIKEVIDLASDDQEAASASIDCVAPTPLLLRRQTCYVEETPQRERVSERPGINPEKYFSSKSTRMEEYHYQSREPIPLEIHQGEECELQTQVMDEDLESLMDLIKDSMEYSSPNPINDL